MRYRERSNYKVTCWGSPFLYETAVPVSGGADVQQGSLASRVTGQRIVRDIKVTIVMRCIVLKLQCDSRKL
jgi:hypothetical protein